MTKAITTFATVSSALLAGSPSPSVAFSPEAKFICERINEPLNSMQQLRSIGNPDLFADLLRLRDECAKNGWDGEDAEPVLAQTVQEMARLLRVLPNTNPMPTLGVEPDGHLTIEWYKSPRRLISISMSPDGFLHYAALIGTSKFFGREPFFGDLPDGILCLIVRIAN